MWGLRCYAALDGISSAYSSVTGRLHTCYSPVRRSPARKASFPSAAPRLACVKPAASVHPEPGSNSPLFILFFRNFSVFVCLDCLFSGSTGKCFLFPCACLVASLSLFSFPLFQGGVSQTRLQSYCLFRPCASIFFRIARLSVDFLVYPLIFSKINFR